jgi:outer membrane protein OmpA-like peptidoglycan-associated protein
MGGKSLILLGLGAGALYSYFCISTHKDQLYEKLYPKVITTDKKDETAVKEVIIKDNPSFTFINSEPFQFNALLNIDAKEDELTQKITQWCQDKSCRNDIQFLENIKKENWSNATQNIISFMIDNQVKNGSISIKDNTIRIAGELKDKSEQDKIENLLSSFNTSFQIQNELVVAEKPIIVEEAIEETIATEEPTMVKEPATVAEEIPNSISTKDTFEESIVSALSTIKEPTVVKHEPIKIEEAQSEINTLLKDTVINFQLNSSNILPSSQKVLDNIIHIVNELNEELEISISGYTDARGSASYNKTLSQKRSDSVKAYLLKHNINTKNITSIGYGEEKLIFTPNDKRNRRVEITLKKGE